MNTLFDLIASLETTHNIIIGILQNFRNYYPDANAQNINIMINLLQEVSSLNQLLNRTSSISVNDSISVYLKVFKYKISSSFNSFIFYNIL